MPEFLEPKDLFLAFVELASLENWTIPEEWNTCEKYVDFLLDIDDYGNTFFNFLNEVYIPHYHRHPFSDQLTCDIFHLIAWQHRRISGENAIMPSLSWFCKDSTSPYLDR